MNINRILDNTWFIKILNIAPIALYVDYNISSLISINRIGNNILLWKITATGEHHLLDFFAVLLCFFALIPIFRKNPKTRKVYGLIAFFTNYFIIAFHETLWYSSIYIENLITNANPYLTLSLVLHSTYLFSYIAVIIAFLLLSRKGAYALPIRTIIILIIYYVYWIYLGFPVTIDYYGHTVFFYDINVNIVEIVSWLIPIFTFLVEQGKYITSMVNESKPSSQSFLTPVRSTRFLIERYIKCQYI